jgi:hypothetical protein
VELHLEWIHDIIDSVNCVIIINMFLTIYSETLLPQDLRKNEVATMQQTLIWLIISNTYCRYFLLPTCFISPIYTPSRVLQFFNKESNNKQLKFVLSG